MRYLLVFFCSVLPALLIAQSADAWVPVAPTGTLPALSSPVVELCGQLFALDRQTLFTSTDEGTSWVEVDYPGREVWLTKSVILSARMQPFNPTMGNQEKRKLYRYDCATGSFTHIGSRTVGTMAIFRGTKFFDFEPLYRRGRPLLHRSMRVSSLLSSLKDTVWVGLPDASSFSPLYTVQIDSLMPDDDLSVRTDSLPLPYTGVYQEAANWYFGEADSINWQVLPNAVGAVYGGGTTSYVDSVGRYIHWPATNGADSLLLPHGPALQYDTLGAQHYVVTAQNIYLAAPDQLATAPPLLSSDQVAGRTIQRVSAYRDQLYVSFTNGELLRVNALGEALPAAPATFTNDFTAIRSNDRQQYALDRYDQWLDISGDTLRRLPVGTAPGSTPRDPFQYKLTDSMEWIVVREASNAYTLQRRTLGTATWDTRLTVPRAPRLFRDGTTLFLVTKKPLSNNGNYFAYYSEDNGTTWTQLINADPIENVLASQGIWYAQLTADRTPVWSTDRGTTWMALPVSGNLYAGREGIYALAYDSEDHVLRYQRIDSPTGQDFSTTTPFGYSIGLGNQLLTDRLESLTVFHSTTGLRNLIGDLAQPFAYSFDVPFRIRRLAGYSGYDPYYAAPLGAYEYTEHSDRLYARAEGGVWWANTCALTSDRQRPTTYVCEGNFYTVGADTLYDDALIDSSYITTAGCSVSLPYAVTFIDSLRILPDTFTCQAFYRGPGTLQAFSSVAQDTLLFGSTVVDGCPQRLEQQVSFELTTADRQGIACNGEPFSFYGVNLPPGDTTVILQDAGDCDTLFRLRVTAASTAYAYDTIQVAPGTVIDGQIINGTQSLVLPTGVLSAAGCDSLIVLRVELLTNTEEAVFPGLHLQPNPVAGELYLSGLPLAPDLSVRLLDTHGRTLRTLSPLSSRATLSLGELPPGVYWLQVRRDNRVRMERVIKQ